MTPTNNLRAALAEPQEPDSPERRCGGPGCDLKCCQPVQEPVAWLRVIDEAMVTHHLGVADPADDYETAKRKMNTLLCMAQDIGTYFAKQAEPVQEPFGYFRAEPFGWTDCAATDEGAIPLYTAPLQRPAEPVQEPDPWGAGYEAGYAAGVAEYDPQPPQQALVEADRIMGHADEATEWRERWGHLFEGLPQRPAEPVQEPAQKTEMRRCPRCWEPMFPPQRKPLTWAERRALWRDSTFRGNGGQMDWFIEGTRAAERAHGIGVQP